MKARIFNFKVSFSNLSTFLDKLGRKFYGRHEILEIYSAGTKRVYSVMFWYKI